MEGWLPYSILGQAVSLFNDYDYKLIVTTGGPREDMYCYPEYSTSGELTAAVLRRLGVKQSFIVSVSAPTVLRDRTYASAVAVKNWLLQSNLSIRSLDVFSLDTHARRTQLLFQSAIGDNIEVGVIASPPVEYDADNWWESSSGVRAVVDEMIAYIYARFLFTPPDETEYQPSQSSSESNASPGIHGRPQLAKQSFDGS